MPADLFEDHRQIIAAAEALLVAVRTVPNPRIEDIGQMRVRVSTLALAHLRHEDEMIVGPLMASGRIEELPQAADMLAEIREGRGVYSDHIRKWTPQAIERDRDGYADSLVVLIDFIKGVFAREEAQLYWPVLKLLAPTLRQQRAQ